jgi:hypothetical protein
MGHLETIEYIIRPDGRVEEKVSGVKGKQVPTHATPPPSM